METKGATASLDCTTFCGLLDSYRETNFDDPSGVDLDVVDYLRETCRQCQKRIRRKAILNIVLSLVSEETGRKAVITR